jgi:hypothetical protein
MEEGNNQEAFNRIRTHAYQSLTWQKKQTTNLYLDERIYQEGESIGPKRQKIVAEKPSILVFADDDPLANFSHECRYLLYDARTGELHREVQAEFPPFIKARPQTLKAFHEPVPFIANPNLFKMKPIFHCPILIPDGKRYAIMFSGMSNKRHLNDMEFLYRTLVDIYSFDPENIYVLHYDGTLNTQDGMQTQWPGDNTAYRIHITGEGTGAAFESAVNGLKGKIGHKDLLLIHANNHGGYDGTPGTANLCTYPNWDAYYANDFANKLAELPKYRKLIVMLEQCHAGGFNNTIIAKSTADATSVASAATEPNNSYVSADGNWDPFARDWIAAQAGYDAFGAALAFNPDADGDRKIEAEEAFAYANAIRLAADTPNFSESSEAGGDITLGQEYTIYWTWWCWILREVLEIYYLRLPPPEYYAKLRELQPELINIAASIDKMSAEMRSEYAEKLKAAIVPIFDKERKK